MQSKNLFLLLSVSLALISLSCSNSHNKGTSTNTKVKIYPSDVIPFMDKWKILLGDGTKSDDLVNFDKQDYFYTTTEGETNWVVYKTPNAGITSRTSKNTRSELGQIARWKPEEGGRLTGTLKVEHVSTLGDATRGSSFSVVVGQIHSDEGHENEPLKIYYKKFPGHTKGSVFWNYEINTEGDNAKRWDYSTAVWGYNMSDVGSSESANLPEPNEGIELGEEFSYEVNVYRGVMHLTFTSPNHEPVKFTKSLTQSEFATSADIPQQILDNYSSKRREGVERKNAYADELQYFKQGAYNQTRALSPELKAAMSDESQTVTTAIEQQYATGCYTEVWFKDATLGDSIEPK